MKPSFVALFLVLFSASLYGQSGSINNTIGSGGSFVVKDGSTTYLSLSQSTGHMTLNKGLRLLNTTSSTVGVIFKLNDRFIHDYAAPGANGLNTFVGVLAGNFSMTSTGLTSSYNTGMGYGSLASLTTGYQNTAVGTSTLSYNTSGSHNTVVGSWAGFSNTTGLENTAVGSYSLYTNTSGHRNTSLGTSALYANSTGLDNTGVGYTSLYANTTGNQNSALGSSSLRLNTTGNYNTAMGYYSLRSNTTGSNNTAVGFYSLYSNSVSSGNTAVGVNALYTNFGFYNTAMGWGALDTNTNGNYNAAFGYNTMASNTNGAENTAMGHDALMNNTSGGYNTAIGSNAGSTITTGQNLILIGYAAQPTNGVTANEVTLGNTLIATLRCATGTITTLSDARDKRNINDLSLGLDFLMTVRPRQFNWDKREWYKNGKGDGSKMKEAPTAGFIAQELDEAQTKANAEWLNLVLKSNPNRLEATAGNLLPILVKGVQELKHENDSLKDEMKIANERIIELERLVHLLDAKLTSR